MIKLRRNKWIILGIVLCIFAVDGLFTVAPHRVYAACTSGITTADKGCCPLQQVTFDANNNTSCDTATAASCQGQQNPQNPTACLFSTYINPAIALLSAAVGVTVVAVIIYGAIEITSSGGDPQRAASGRNRIRDALVALGVYLLLFAFLQFITPGGLL